MESLSVQEEANTAGKIKAEKTSSLTEDLQDQVCSYAAGALIGSDRDLFEAEIEQNPELLRFTAELLEISTRLMINSLPCISYAPCSVKDRVLKRVDALIALEKAIGDFSVKPGDCLVLTDSEGLIFWVNDTFSRMCGYSMTELLGKKPGSVLQGPGTDPSVVSRIRASMSSNRRCREELINYHKNGRPYRVSIDINPLEGHDGATCGFLAIEQEIKY
ncbi:MAG: PAS domain-containing protein [Verrucomicrobia bacterium]|nr:PAS domain-containing protein [Verrucomicrobiota bacterium]